MAEAMADLFGVKLVAATIAGMSRRCAERYQDFAGAVCALVKTAAVKHMDKPSGNAGGDKPASGSAARLSGCMSPVPCGWSSIGFHPSAAACWRASPASWFTITGSPTELVPKNSHDRQSSAQAYVSLLQPSVSGSTKL
jgi:hypothetical protein